MRYHDFSPAPIFYFSYGMLCDPDIMPEAEFIGSAVLPNFKFEMLQYANVIPAPGKQVNGVLWNVDRSFLGKLDRIEDCPWLYNRKTVKVMCNNDRYEAELYTMTPIAREDLQGTLPSKHYVLSIINGYRNAQISVDQIRHALKGIDTDNIPLKTIPLPNHQITEVKMSPGVLKKFASKPLAANAVVGFEAEMIIPNLKSFDDTEEYVEDYTQDIPFPSDDKWYKKALEWLTDGDNPNDMQYTEYQLDRFETKYHAFIEDKLQDYINSNRGKLAIIQFIAAKRGGDVSKDIIEKDINDQNDWYDYAVDEIRTDFYKSTNYMPQFLDDVGIHTMRQFCREHYLSWPYYKKEISDDDALTANELELSFVEATGYTATVGHEYQSVKRKEGLWIFEPDGSLEPQETVGSGIELISPPMKFQEAMTAIDNFWSWAEKVGAISNNTCGFHVGVSIPNKTDEIDMVKMILFLGDEHVLTTFNRQKNSYTESIIKRIKEKLDQTSYRFDIDKLLTEFKKGISKLAKNTIIQAMTKIDDRYISVNIHENYVEFRSAGGNYLEDKGEIVNTILRYVRVMSIAADPNLYKDEYAKKLYKLISSGKESKDTLYYFSLFSAGQIDKSTLKSHLRQANFKRFTTNATIPKTNPRNLMGLPRYVDHENEEI